MNGTKLSVQIIFATVSLLCLSCVRLLAQRYPLTFQGNASGGSLTLGVTHGYGPKCVSIQTSPGESAESVARRLADQITSNHAKQSPRETETLWSGSGANASGATLTLASTLDSYYLAGTETGLGIPDPPVFLTCVYDSEADIIRLSWENPPGDYDAISVTLEWRAGGAVRTAKRSLPGDATTFVSSPGGINSITPLTVEDFFVAVVGFRTGIMSAPAALHVSGRYQDEAFAIPFARGVIPNWRTWGCRGRDPRECFTMGRRYNTSVMYFPEDGLQRKPFYQVIGADRSGPVGLYRRFSGLIPGHTYRVTIGLSNLELEHDRNSKWVFSVHATHGQPGGKGLSGEQLAGKMPLPSGKKGSAAGRIVALGRAEGRYISREFTGRGFKLMRSRATRVPASNDATDVTLPAGIDTLTVWVRFECSDPNAKVGLLGVGLEDVTADR